MTRILQQAGAALALVAFLWVAGTGVGHAETAKLSGVVNLNTATAEQLEALPGIGESRARAVIAQREAVGGFKRVEDLLDVKGIGEAGFARLKPHLSVEGKTTFRRQD
ncbi:MAG: ComEA family DNA-binding protein [Myxococcota bacterium]